MQITVQLKSMKGRNISSFRHFDFSIGKIQRNENRSLTEIHNGNADIISPFGNHSNF